MPTLEIQRDRSILPKEVSPDPGSSLKGERYIGKLRLGNGYDRTFYGNSEHAYELNGPLVPDPMLCYEMLKPVMPGKQSFLIERTKDNTTLTEVRTCDILGSQVMGVHNDAVGHRSIDVMLYVRGKYSDLGWQTQQPWSGGPETVLFARVSVSPEQGGEISTKLVQDWSEYKKLHSYVRSLFPERYGVCVKFDEGKDEMGKTNKSEYTNSKALKQTDVWQRRYKSHRAVITHFEENARAYSKKLADMERKEAYVQLGHTPELAVAADD